MQNREDDLFFQHLNDKLAELKGKDASEQDWQDFQRAYARHKQTKGNKKAAVWFTVAAMVSFCGVMLWNPLFLKPNQSAQNVKSKNDSTSILLSNEPAQSDLTRSKPMYANEYQKPNNSTHISVTPSDKTAPENHLISVEETTARANQQSGKPISTPNQTAPTYKHSSNRDVHPLVTVNPSSMYQQGKQTVVVSIDSPTALHFFAEKVHPHSSLPSTDSLTVSNDTGIFASEIQQQLTAVKADSTSSTRIPGVPYDTTDFTKSRIAVPQSPWFAELNMVAYSSYGPRQPYPSDVYYKGGGINVGYKLRKKLTLLGGLNYAAMREINTIVLNEEYTKDEILRIDSTLKLNLADNRIGLQVDTITQSKTYTSQSSIKLNTDKHIVSLPLALQYRVGSAKFGLNAMGGLTTLLILENVTTLDNAGLPSENRKSTTTHKVTIAPTIGLGMFRKVYRNIDFHVDGYYLFLLPNSLTQYNMIHLQTGLRYHF